MKFEKLKRIYLIAAVVLAIVAIGIVYKTTEIAPKTTTGYTYEVKQCTECKKYVAQNGAGHASNCLRKGLGWHNKGKGIKWEWN